MDTRRTADEDETTLKTTRYDTEKQQGAPSITDDAPILVIFEIFKKNISSTLTAIWFISQNNHLTKQILKNFYLQLKHFR